jgi:bifunctional DNase/RNase
VVPLELVGVRVEVPANTPMLLLREATGRHRLMPIYIGTPEATAIHYALEGIESPRPLTHDLFVQALAELGVTLERVVVTEMREHTYFAELHLRRPDNELTVISSRTSDAIALAVRCGAAMLANESLLDLVGQEPTPEPEEAASEIIDEFREFIDQVNPEDFG